MSPFSFFTDPATPQIYTLSLHDALPIYFREHAAPDAIQAERAAGRGDPQHAPRQAHRPGDRQARSGAQGSRSEEHTSELQSPDHLVCRLLLEKKKRKKNKKIMKRAYTES